ncbi:PUA-like protein [Trichocladium antarcticum]|uniref:PUA-like protein n=1 Tax=Trichocladium antarcticum TaxID=1450529 RepID=A0AAN6ULC4_9PEZI|nr:PUA-like protein [Trichocladium antarcticum]
MSAIDPNRSDIAAFMAMASAALGQPLPPPKDVSSFGDPNTTLADTLLQLAIQRKKTATASWPVPNPLYWGVGDLSVILDGNGAPAAVIRTTSFVQCKFRDIDEDFALAEAEGDYKSYRESHIVFFRRQENGHEFGDDSIMLCERFEVIYPAAAAERSG